MKKLRIFLDTTIIISYFNKEVNVRKLFSKEVLEKVQYIINPIVYQEIFLSDKIKNSIDFKKLNDNVNLVQIDTKEIDIKKISELRNNLVHTNDFLILQTAIFNSDYLLTLDQAMIGIGKINSLKVISPNEFFKLLGVRQ
jgi:predicted nucleic acid-binding protein